MRHAVTTTLLLALCAIAQPPSRDAHAKAFVSLAREYDGQIAELRKAVDAARTPEEKRAVLEKQHPRHSVFASRFMKIAAEGPDSPAAVDALLWVVLHPVEPDHKASALRGQA